MLACPMISWSILGDSQRPGPGGARRTSTGLYGSGQGNWSVEGLKFVEFPGLVEPWLERAVEAEERKPGFAGDRLDPVRLLALRGRGAEVQVVGSVGVGLQ